MSEPTSPPRTPRTRQPIPETALITGAGRRVGREIALRLAREGFDIAVHYGRSGDEAAAVADEVRALGRRATTVQGDLGVEAEVEPLVDRAAAELGPIGVLVNNASLFHPDDLATMTRATWDRHMEANLRAPVVLMQRYVAQLPDSADGAIVNLLDQRVLNPTAEFLSYTVTKMALKALTHTLALDLAPRVRVNGVGPGPTLASIHQSQEVFDYQAAATPLQHASVPPDIAEAVVYLVRARSVTGQMIAVDGGQHLWWAPPGVDTPRDV